MNDPVQFTIDHIDAYLHGALAPEEERVVREQCGRNPVCGAALEEAEKRLAAVRSIPPVEAGDGLINKTLARLDAAVEADSRRARAWRYFGGIVATAAAIAVAVIGGMHFYYGTLAPTPYDLRVLGQDELLAGSQASLRVGLFIHATRAPVMGVPVEVALVRAADGKTVRLAKFESGESPPSFELPDWEEGSYELRVTAHTDAGEETIVRRVKLVRSWKVMLSTDKPVYKPGQMIHLRSLSLRRPDLHPVAGEEALFTIRDPQGNIVFKQAGVTGKYGIAWADFQLAGEVNEGAYEIECLVGGTAGTQTVQVEKYVLPKFQVVVALDKPFYAPGERVEGTIEARYFFDQPVAGGEVKIEARSEGFAGGVIATITETTDAEGKVGFQFILPQRMFGREQDGEDARLLLAATVTDTAGQVHSAGTSRLVTAEPIKLAIIPEGGTFVRGAPNMVYVYASYADGRPAQELDVAVSGRSETLLTNTLGVASFQTTPEEESFRLTISAHDAAGRSAVTSRSFTCGSAAGDFLVRTDKAVYDGGDTMTISLVGGGVEPVFIDLIKDGQTMLTTTIEPAANGDDDKGAIAVDLPPEMFGAVRLVAYRYGRTGLPVRKERMIYVRQAGDLRIEAAFDADEYRPGQSARLTLRLTDAEGKPVPGAVSLAAVDEAVFSVLNQRAGMEEIFFLLEEELLQPVYAIYDAWSPQPLPAEISLADRREFDQALFARTAGGESGVKALPVEFGGWEERLDKRDGGEEWLDGGEWAPAIDQKTTDASAHDAAAYDNPYSLAGQSYGDKVASVHQTKESGLAATWIAWIALAVSMVLVGLVTFAIARPKVFLVTAGIAALSCVGLGLPALLLAGAYFSVQIAQDAARFDESGASAAADMAGGELAMSEMEGDGAFGDPWAGESAVAPPRVRRWFPETLLWRPQIITDEDGVAIVEFDLADSITQWRLSASAVSGDGRLGGGQFPIKVFQPFFVELDLPVALTRGDEIGIPLVVYNYLGEPQTVELTVDDAAWFERIAGEEPGDAQTLSLEIPPGESRSVSFPIRVKEVGLHRLTVTAQGKGAADAIEREIEVVPNGRRIEESYSGTLDEPAEIALSVPDERIEGSTRAIVKIHPSSFSQLVEGLDAIFQMPYGCFEQTSSSTYPNVLALDYLRRTKTSAPAVEAKAREYIGLGYQRLVSFEVSGGGFDWFGNPPANSTLTAYGLLEFQDMARVYDVDPALIERTRRWLLSQRKGDGSWPAEVGMLDDGLAGSVQRGGDPDLASTAYVAWAVFHDGAARSESAPTLAWLLAHSPASVDDPYVVAITIAAIAAIDKEHKALDRWLERLAELKKSADGGKLVWWEQPAGSQTMFYGGGQAASVETTALASLAMLDAGAGPSDIRGALNWLIRQKDPSGTWHSTQATVLALQALIAATGASLGGDQHRVIEIALGGEIVRTLEIPADQADVMQQVDLSPLVTGGNYRLSIRERTTAGSSFQVALRYHVEEPAAAEPEKQPLAIGIAYDRTTLQVNEHVAATATVVNNMQQTAPMVILDLPIPGGFAIEPGELDELARSGEIAKYQITARQAIVYLRELKPGRPLVLRYRLKATMPVKVAAGPGEAYEYYNPEHRGHGGAAELEAR